MEEFGWILFIAVFWVLSSIGEFRKSQKERHREEAEEAAPRPRRAEQRPRGRERAGPHAGRRELARDVEEGARQADEALRRWEARQRATQGPAEPAAALPAKVSDERHEAYAAIADMLAGKPSEPVGYRPEVERTGDPDAPRRSERPDPLETAGAPTPPVRPRYGEASPPLRRPRLATSRPTVPPRPASGASALEHLSRLSPLRSAVVWSELLGPPVALREDPPLRR